VAERQRIDGDPNPDPTLCLDDDLDRTGFK
jgi:hypothetical protein